MKQIEVKGLTFGYGNHIVQEEITFSVNSGDFVCFIGENGSGKSTLLKILLGLHKPICGEVDVKINRTEIGYLPQQDDIQKDFPASVNEVVMSGCLNKIKWYVPFYKKPQQERTDQALSQVNVADLKTQCYRELSGGQQQRVLLARALCSAEKMIVLDEPIANLDPNCAKEFYSVLEKINKDGMTVLMVSHDVKTATKHATHILQLNTLEDDCCDTETDGQPSYFFGTTKDFENPIPCANAIPANKQIGGKK